MGRCVTFAQGPPSGYATVHVTANVFKAIILATLFSLAHSELVNVCKKQFIFSASFFL